VLGLGSGLGNSLRVYKLGARVYGLGEQVY